jgi:hypothetical protein
MYIDSPGVCGLTSEFRPEWHLAAQLEAADSVLSCLLMSCNRLHIAYSIDCATRLGLCFTPKLVSNALLCSLVYISRPSSCRID